MHPPVDWYWTADAGVKFFTSRGNSAVFRGNSAVFPCRGHKGTAKFPSRKSRLIGKKFSFQPNLVPRLEPQAQASGIVIKRARSWPFAYCFELTPRLSLHLIPFLQHAHDVFLGAHHHFPHHASHHPVVVRIDIHPKPGSGALGPNPVVIAGFARR